LPSTNISICWHFKTTPTKWKQIKFHWWCWCHKNCNQPLFTGLILFLQVTSGHSSHFDGDFFFWCRLVDIKIVYDRSLCPFLYWCGNTNTGRERTWICVFWVSILPLSTNICLDFWTILILWYFMFSIFYW